MARSSFGSLKVPKTRRGPRSFIVDQKDHGGHQKLNVSSWPTTGHWTTIIGIKTVRVGRALEGGGGIKEEKVSRLMGS